MGRIYETPPYLCDASAMAEVDRASIRDALMDDPLQGEPLAGVEGFRIVPIAALDERQRDERKVMTLYVVETDNLFLLGLLEPGPEAEFSLPDRRDVAAAASRALAFARPKVRRLVVVR